MCSVFLLQLESRDYSCFLGKLVIGKAPIERKVDSASHQIDLYPLDSAVIAQGQPFEQLAPVVEGSFVMENGKKRLVRVCRRGGGGIAELKLATNNEC